MTELTVPEQLKGRFDRAHENAIQALCSHEAKGQFPPHLQTAYYNTLIASDAYVRNLENRRDGVSAEAGLQMHDRLRQLAEGFVTVGLDDQAESVERMLSRLGDAVDARLEAGLR